MKAYSEDLRERVVAVVGDGMPTAEAATLFQVGWTTVKRWMNMFAETGSLNPKPRPGRPCKITKDQYPLLAEQIKAHPDEVLDKQCEMWNEAHGVNVSRATMSRTLAKMAHTIKKKTKRAAERNEEARASYRERAAKFDPRRLVIFDESGTKIGMTPNNAWSPEGERASVSEIHNQGENVSVLASLTTKGMGAVMTVNGAADADVLVAYIEKVLVPTLRPGQIVIMDNLSTHKDSRVAALLKEAQCQLVFLPAYSPDFSPIEEAFSKLKSIVRRLKATTRDELEAAIAKAVEAISGKDAKGWFRHCGYDFYWL